MTDPLSQLLVHDGTFALVDGALEITGVRGVRPDGLFRRDARHLSHWRLTVDGAAPQVLLPAHRAARASTVQGHGPSPAGGPGASAHRTEDDEPRAGRPANGVGGQTSWAAGTASAAAVLTPAGARGAPPVCTLFREQTVAGGRLAERLTVVNNRPEAVTVRLALTADADFADQFALRSDGRDYPRPGVRTAQPLSGGVEFAYRRGAWHARTTVLADPAPETVAPAPGPPGVAAPSDASVDAGPSTAAQRPASALPAPDPRAHTLTWDLHLPPHGTRELRLLVRASAPGDRLADEPSGTATPGAQGCAAGHSGPLSGRVSEAASLPDPAALAAEVDADAEEFARAAPLPYGPHATPPGPATPDDGTAALRHRLDAACRRGLADLAGLRITVPGPAGEPLRVPGAGVPWFLTLFGRDSLLTSLFALPWRSGLATATLGALAATQAHEEDAERLAEPGRIVHEVRHGELAHHRQVPFGRYYGTVDATPLFLVLLAAHTRQARARGGAEAVEVTALARELEGAAREATHWMFRYGGLREFGYLAYRAHEGGLAHQNWKDSPGAICAADGTPAQGAVFVAEAQGYAYDALRGTAQLAREVWQDAPWAAQLDVAAEELRRRFTADFWLPEADFPALALDDAGGVADALASDAGHLLWSGILDGEHGKRVGRRLLEPDFFSGWGVRTLAAGQAPYHPLSYHRGSVWPHDNALLALGLARYGLHSEVRTLAGGLLDAAAAHDHRLPEVLAGYGRDRHARPVPYPHACSPQAWAAATPLALRTALAAGTDGSPDGTGFGS